MKNDCYYITQADGFVHGELTENEQIEFEHHLESCDQCRSEVEYLKKLSGGLNAAYSSRLDETFNYRIIKNLRSEGLAENRKEMRGALEDIVISLATLLIIVILGIQMFDRSPVSPVEMVGSLTNAEKISVEQQSLSNDQVLELVMRSK